MIHALPSAHRTALVFAVVSIGAAAVLVPPLLGNPIAPVAAATRASVILVDDFAQWLPPDIAARRPADAPPPRAVVIRRSTSAPPNVILVTNTTGPDDLMKAIGVLAASIKRKPNARGEMRAYVSPARAHPSAARSWPQASNDLARLATAREYDIAGVGRRKAIAIRINATAKRVKVALATRVP